MQRIALLSLVVLLCAFSARAQQFPASIPPGEARIQSLEEQVRTLAEQVALLRSELQAMRQTQTPAAPANHQVVLTAAHVEPGVASVSSADAVSASTASVPSTEPVATAPGPPQVAWGFGDRSGGGVVHATDRRGLDDPQLRQVAAGQSRIQSETSAYDAAES